MDALIAAAAVAVLGALVLAAGLMAYRLWCAGVREERALLMHRVLEREGVTLDGCADKGTLAQTAAAARRCLLCRDRETCVAWLEGDAAVPLDRFCPNADLIARLKAEGRASLPGAGYACH
jgi:hypothetical protein